MENQARIYYSSLFKNGSQAETAHFIVIPVVVAAVASGVCCLPGTRSITELCLLKVLVPFQSNYLRSYAASGFWEEFLRVYMFPFLEAVRLRVCIMKVAQEVLTDPQSFLAALQGFCFNSVQVTHLLNVLTSTQKSFPSFLPIDLF